MAKVVVIGSGAREHALVRALRRSEAELVAIPGNPGVATPDAAVFEDPASAREHARFTGASVVKLDGLAAGKGVIVADDGAQAAAAVEDLWRPGAKLLIEQRLEGPEMSVIALCDGEHVVPLPPARDHKRLLDGDKGPNTGG